MQNIKCSIACFHLMQLGALMQTLWDWTLFPYLPDKLSLIKTNKNTSWITEVDFILLSNLLMAYLFKLFATTLIIPCNLIAVLFQNSLFLPPIQDPFPHTQHSPPMLWLSSCVFYRPPGRNLQNTGWKTLTVQLIRKVEIPLKFWLVL